MLKLNSDASVSTEGVTTGVVLKRGDEVIAIRYNYYPLLKDPNMGELLGVEQAVNLACSHHAREVLICSDSVYAISALDNLLKGNVKVKHPLAFYTMVRLQKLLECYPIHIEVAKVERSSPDQALADWVSRLKTEDKDYVGAQLEKLLSAYRVHTVLSAM